ncbi:MAG: YkuS family protein, partial [Clostridia bacterium]|nr:YkuS family protein [Clostridia bacterium]
IGIEKSLTDVKEYLEQNNQKAVLLDGSKKSSNRALKKYDVIVTSGMDSNFLGMHDTVTKTQVVNADGKTPEEVLNEIKSRLE